MAVRRFVSEVSVILCALSLPALAAAQVLATPSAAASTPPSGVATTFGTTQTSYVDVGEWEFSPLNSATLYADVALGSPNFLRYSTAGNNSFVAPLHLPSGSVLQSVELDACDSNTGNSAHVVELMEHCDHVTGLCAPIGNLITSTSASINPCTSYVQDLSTVGYVVDNAGDRLLLQVVTQAGNEKTAFAGVKVGYKLQVSAAPASADFGDVPVSHPFFQFIEALYQSGITGGCGSGNFCPDTPVTRGQMAVFLAKGLGLQFP